MNEESRANIEIIAPSIDEAVEKGLKELGVSKYQVEIEVLDEGKEGGLFGLGGRDARVRLTLSGSAPADAALGADEPALETRQEEPAASKTDSGDRVHDDPDLENFRGIAEATVRELLEKMDILRVDVEATIAIPEDDDRPRITVNVLGDDLSILIGKKAETLNALQYITRLIVGKEVGRGVNLVVDVEGYRDRREKNLRHLARRMASQAVKTERRQTLEPMPANERRIVHLELRDNDEVTTESVGDDPRRKVTIIPNN